MRTAMTAIDGVLTPEAEPSAPEAGPTVAPRRRAWPRLLIGFVVGFLLCLGLAAGALYAYDSNHEARVLGGVSVGGVDLSGQDQAQAAATLTAAFGAYGEGRVVIHTTEGDAEVPYSAFSRPRRRPGDGRCGPLDGPDRDRARARGRGSAPARLGVVARAARDPRRGGPRRGHPGRGLAVRPPARGQPAARRPEDDHGHASVPGPVLRRDRRGRRRPGDAAADRCAGRDRGRRDGDDDATRRRACRRRSPSARPPSG